MPTQPTSPLDRAHPHAEAGTARPTWSYPPIGANPGTGAATTPGSFANPSRVGTPWAFSSPDTPGMPPVSDKTAWDFLPDDWGCEIGRASCRERVYTKV